MPEVSGARLAQLTGMTWRTVKSRLDAGGITRIRRERNADLFDSVAALAAIYAPKRGGAGGDALDIEQERARLAKEQADKTAMDNAVRRGELADLADVRREWSQALASFRARMLAVPSKLAPQVAPENPNLARDLIAVEHDAILRDLASVDARSVEGELPDPDGGAAVPAAPATEVDGKPVGRRVPKAKRRK